MTTPPEHTIVDQVKLPVGVAFQVVLQGMRIRFGRSLVTIMGVVLGIRNATSRETLFENLDTVCDYLAGSRPTAVNLFWALERMKNHARELGDLPVGELQTGLLAEAREIRREDDHLFITSANVTATVGELVDWARAERCELVGLEVRRPSLEDVYLELAEVSR